MVKNVCSERKTIIPKPIIRLTSFDLIQTTIFLPRAKDYLTTFDRGTLAIRDLRLCARLAIGQRFLSREVAVESRGGRRSETPISRFPGPGVRQWYRRRFVERKWEWKWPVGWIRFFDPSIKECETWSMSVCLDKPTHDDSREQRSDFFLFPFFLSLKWRRSSNLGTVSEISFHPPLFLQYP